MNPAAKERERKEKHPELYCTSPGCLWRVKSISGGIDRPCPKHGSRVKQEVKDGQA